jgi:hypothetical protein
MTESPSDLIDRRIAELGDWRGDTLARVRALDGIITTGETYKDKVKLTFARGASLEDPKKLFNSSLEGNARRALDLFEGDAVDEAAFKALVREAVELNAVARGRR